MAKLSVYGVMFLDSNAWSPDDPTTGGDCSLVPLPLSGIAQAFSAIALRCNKV